MQWNIKPDRPVYLQLIEEIELLLINDYYKAGDKLPTVRELAMEAKVSPNTMQRALTYLELKGLLVAKRTSGIFITTDEQMLKDVRKNLAINKVDNVFAEMARLGYSEQQTIDFMQMLIKERE